MGQHFTPWRVYVITQSSGFSLKTAMRLVTQSFLTRCDPLGYRPPGSSAHGIFQSRILEWVAIFLLQGIFPTQGWNPRLLYLLHCKQILYPLSHQRKLEDVAKDSSWSPAKWLESPYSLVTRVQHSFSHLVFRDWIFLPWPSKIS